MPKTPWTHEKLVATVRQMITPANLAHNLHQLASIKAGDKIRVENARVVVTGGGKWAGLFSRKDEDSILATGGVGGVWAQFFAYASRGFTEGVAGVTLTALGGAFEGLRRLRTAYAGRVDAVGLVDAMLLHCQEAYRQAVAYDQRRGFYTRWGERIRPFDQSSYLPEGSNGACYGFCYDWARRIVFRGKMSYFQSKKAHPPADADRFRNKLTKRVLAVQSNYESGRYSTANPIRDPKGKCGSLWFDPARSIMNLVYGSVPSELEKEATTRNLFDACISSVRAAEGRHTGCFLVCLKGEYGHAVAVHYSAEEGGQFAIFDPNVGEARFIAVERRLLEQMWVEMLALHQAKGCTMTSITLQPLVLRPR